MAKRYEPRSPFSIDVNGVPPTFVPGRIDPVTKLQGYSDADLKGVPKVHRASFVEIAADFGDDDTETVEQATAAPGEKRTTRRSTSTKK